MTELRAPYQIINRPEGVQIRIPVQWHKVLLRLWQMERLGHQLAIVQFCGEQGPKCREVGKLEG